MGTISHIFLDSTKKEYIPNQCQWKPEKGIFDLKPYEVRFSVDEIKQRPPSMWRYKEALPFESSKDVSSFSLGEGMTPLLPLDKNEPNFLVKLDYLMPTGSFKDRGASVLVGKAKELGVTTVIADSSGNAGTSMAAYCARANITCHIFVPEYTSSKKLAQIEAFGAELHRISGTREETAKAAQRAVKEKGIFYASHVYNPFFYEGTKTFAFEIWEQFHYKVPDKVIVPVGNGTLLLGAYIGFKNLRDAGVIRHVPKIVGVQSEECQPIAKAFRENKSTSAVENKGTAAEGIAIAAPVRGDQVLQAIKETNGTIITAPEKEIESAKKELALKGFFVEPTTAATYAAFKEYKDRILNPDEVVVMSLCGSGLKK